MRTIVHIVAAAGLLAGAAQAATLQEWQQADLESIVTVSRTEQPGIYKVTAVLRDAKTQMVLSNPVLRVGTDKPATLENGVDKGPQGSFLYTLRVKVLPDGSGATFSSRFTRDAKVSGITSGVLAVQPSGTDVAAPTVPRFLPAERPLVHFPSEPFVPVEVGLGPALKELADVQRQLETLRVALDGISFSAADFETVRSALRQLEDREAFLQSTVTSARERLRHRSLILHIVPA